MRARVAIKQQLRERRAAEAAERERLAKDLAAGGDPVAELSSSSAAAGHQILNASEDKFESVNAYFGAKQRNEVVRNHPDGEQDNHQHLSTPGREQIEERKRRGALLGAKSTGRRGRGNRDHFLEQHNILLRSIQKSKRKRSKHWSSSPNILGNNYKNSEYNKHGNKLLARDETAVFQKLHFAADDWSFKWLTAPGLGSFRPEDFNQVRRLLERHPISEHIDVEENLEQIAMCMAHTNAALEYYEFNAVSVAAIEQGQVLSQNAIGGGGHQQNRLIPPHQHEVQKIAKSWSHAFLDLVRLARDHGDAVRERERKMELRRKNRMPKSRRKVAFSEDEEEVDDDNDKKNLPNGREKNKMSKLQLQTPARGAASGGGNKKNIRKPPSNKIISDSSASDDDDFDSSDELALDEMNANHNSMFVADHGQSMVVMFRSDTEIHASPTKPEFRDLLKKHQVPFDCPAESFDLKKQTAATAAAGGERAGVLDSNQFENRQVLENFLNIDRGVRANVAVGKRKSSDTSVFVKGVGAVAAFADVYRMEQVRSYLQHPTKNPVPRLVAQRPFLNASYKRCSAKTMVETVKGVAMSNSTGSNNTGAAGAGAGTSSSKQGNSSKKDENATSKSTTRPKLNSDDKVAPMKLNMDEDDPMEDIIAEADAKDNQEKDQNKEQHAKQATDIPLEENESEEADIERHHVTITGILFPHQVQAFLIKATAAQEYSASLVPLCVSGAEEERKFLREVSYTCDGEMEEDVFHMKYEKIQVETTG
ncbi:unnamed protein product [Amoebophrya sp. A120]|nr:unnamed protein product [Amoebophrya sp. A120]|eukprot:GSA120T00008156001.1